MEKLRHSLNLAVEPGTASERMKNKVNELKQYRGRLTKNINAWVNAGFMLSEMGAVIHAWNGMDETGELDGMSQSEKAAVLRDLLAMLADKEEPKPIRRTEAIEPLQPEPPKKPPNTLENLGCDLGA